LPSGPVSTGGAAGGGALLESCDGEVGGAEDGSGGGLGVTTREGVDEGVELGVVLGVVLGEPLPPLGDGEGEPDVEHDGVGVGVGVPEAVDAPVAAAPEAALEVWLELGEPEVQLVSGLADGEPEAACAGIASTAPIATVPDATAPITVAVERPVCLRRTAMRPPPCRALPSIVRVPLSIMAPGGTPVHRSQSPSSGHPPAAR
jgi:hypothetical protein